MAASDTYSIFKTDVDQTARYPSLAELSTGEFVAVWYARDVDGSNTGVLGQKLSATGEKIGGEFLVNTHVADDQQNPDVVTLENGRFVVSWQSDEQDVPEGQAVGVRGTSGIYAQIFGADGGKEGSEFLVNTFTQGFQSFTNVGALADGGFAITWNAYDAQATESPFSEGIGIFGQVFNSDGSRRGSELDINTYRDQDQLYSSTAGLADGSFVVTWTSEGTSARTIDTQDGYQGGVFAQRLSATGEKIGTGFQVHTYTQHTQDQSDVIGLTGGGYVVVWRSGVLDDGVHSPQGQDGSGHGVFAQIFAADGTKAGLQFRVNTTTDGDQYQPSVSASSDGGFVVAWRSEDRINAQRFDAAGATVGEEVTLAEAQGSGIVATPDVVAASGGGLLAAWYHTNSSSGAAEGAERGIAVNLFQEGAAPPQPGNVANVDYTSLLIGPGSGTAWHDGTKSLTYSFLSDTMPAYYPEVDIPAAQGGGQTDAADAYALGQHEDGTPEFIVALDANLALNAAQTMAVEQAIRGWNELASINLTQGTVDGTDFGELTFGVYEGLVLETRDSEGREIPTLPPVGVPGTTAAAFAYDPDPAELGEATVSGDVWFDKPQIEDNAIGGYAYSTFLHEIGHALGLSHPNNAPSDTTSPKNTEQYTLMSYNNHPNLSAATGDAPDFDDIIYAATPMLFDVQAIQHLYGANQSTRVGDNTYFGSAAGNTYGIADGESKLVTVWDALGIDTFDGSNQTNRVDIDLNPGQFSTIGKIENNIAIASNLTADGQVIENADSAWIENALGGSADDILIGNILGNEFTGGKGDDLIGGGAGSDTSIYLGEKSQFSVTIVKDNASIVQDRKTDGEGTDFVSEVERLEFADDQALVLSILEGVANISSADLVSFIELYIAYFNRAPDAEGLFYWGTRLSEGMSKEDIAASFFVQPETQALYPDPNDTEGFVTSVYNNFLGRAPDPEGFAYWVGELENGNVSNPTFLLAIINGAKAATGNPMDVEYLSRKADIGAYYAVIKGLSNTDNAQTALALYDGSEQSAIAAKNAIDGYHTAALDAESGELLINLVGVMDDPFAAV